MNPGQVTVSIDADTSGALAKLAEIEQRLAEINRQADIVALKVARAGQKTGQRHGEQTGQ